MRLLPSLFLTLLAWTSHAHAASSEVIETNSVVIPLAPGWVEETGADPITAIGPNGQGMLVTVFTLRAQQGTAVEPELLDPAEALGTKAISSCPPGMKIIRPMTTYSLANGTGIREVACRSEDGKYSFNGMVLRGKRAVILATIEGPSSSDDQLEAAAHSLKSLTWK